MRLNTLENARKTYARFLRAYAAGIIPSGYFRDIVYGFSGFLQYWKLEKDIEIEERIEALEAKIDEVLARKTGGQPN